MQTLPVLSCDSSQPSDTSLTRNSLLDQIQIAAPCPASWDDMRGDDAQRFCGGCQKSVYNFAGMTSFEAESLIFETEGDLCVRLFRRQDGTIITSDCPVGLAERAWRRARNTTLASISLVIVLFTGALVALFGAARTEGVTTKVDVIKDKVDAHIIPVARPLAGAPMPIEMGDVGEMGYSAPPVVPSRVAPKQIAPKAVKMGKMTSSPNP